MVTQWPLHIKYYQVLNRISSQGVWKKLGSLRGACQKIIENSLVPQRSSCCCSCDLRRNNNSFLHNLSLLLVGSGWGRRVSKQRHWVLHHDGRSRQRVWHQLRHRGDQTEAVHQVDGDRPEHHQAEGLQVVSGGRGQGPRLSVLQHNSCGQHWYHRSGRNFFKTLHACCASYYPPKLLKIRSIVD